MVVPLLIALLSAQVAAPEIGKPAPKLRGFDTKKNKVIVPIEGRITIVSFFATWCAPCAVELPILRRVAEKHPNAELVLVSFNQGASEVARYLERLELNNVCVLPDRSGFFGARYRVNSIPATFVIDAGGNLRESMTSLTSEKQISAILSQLEKN